MPFKSKAQQRFMFKFHPDIARRWARDYGVPGNLPSHVGMAHVLASHARRRKRKSKKA